MIYIERHYLIVFNDLFYQNYFLLYRSYFLFATFPARKRVMYICQPRVIISFVNPPTFLVLLASGGQEFFRGVVLSGARASLNKWKTFRL